MSSERLHLGRSSERGGLLAVLFAVYLSAIAAVQLWFILDPAYLHEEMRGLFRYHALADPALFDGDYLAGFAGAFPQPYLYEGLTRLWLRAGGDLILLHRLLPLACWLALLAGTALAARRLGDRLTALGAVGLVAAQPLYLYQITSALPHAFAFPLLMWALVALLHGSRRGLVAVTVLSGLLYPAVTPLAGLLLAWQVVVLQGFLGQANRERAKALLLLTVTGALSLWLVFTSLGAPAGFGEPLAPMQRVDVYPENGPDGRHFYGVFNPILYVVGKALGQFRTSEELLALAVLLACGLIALYGFVRLPKGGRRRRALAGFVLCSLAVCLAIYLARPYHSYRFILYPAFTLLPLLTVAGLQEVCRQLGAFLRLPEAVAVAVLALLVLCFDSFDAKKAGYRWHLGPDARQVMAFAAAQPADRLFAIWPGSDSELELLPYLARRPVFVQRKLHYPTYEGHLLALRERMNGLIDAYLATDPAPLQALHCRWGVDYLVVERSHFVPGGARPAYFAPFDGRIADIWQAHEPGDFLLATPPAAAVVLRVGPFRLVDLAGFPGVDCPAARAD